MPEKTSDNLTTLRLPAWMWEEFDAVLAKVAEAKGMHVTRKEALASVIASLLSVENLADQIKWLQDGSNWIARRAEARVRAQSSGEEDSEFEAGRELVRKAEQAARAETKSRKRKGA